MNMERANIGRKLAHHSPSSDSGELSPEARGRSEPIAGTSREEPMRSRAKSDTDDIQVAPEQPTPGPSRTTAYFDRSFSYENEGEVSFSERQMGFSWRGRSDSIYLFGQPNTVMNAVQAVDEEVGFIEVHRSQSGDTVSNRVSDTDSYPTLIRFPKCKLIYYDADTLERVDSHPRLRKSGIINVQMDPFDIEEEVEFGKVNKKKNLTSKLFCVYLTQVIIIIILVTAIIMVVVTLIRIRFLNDDTADHTKNFRHPTLFG